jgi:glucose-6-phosphate isomerase
MNTVSPTACAAWKKLAAHARRAPAIAGGARLVQAPGVTLDYSRQRIDAEGIALLAQLAAERGFDEWRTALFAGEKINSTEDRAVGHTAVRANDAAFLKMKGLAEKIRREGRFTRIINLGTGGSDFGPRLLADAFADGALDVRFVANVDLLELERAIAGAGPKSTLVVVASKTFTTQETMSNAGELKRRGYADFVAATANPAAARSFGASEVLEFPESVGGRFSVWSAAGFAGLLAVGGAAFAEFLAGARDIDEHFRREPLERNLPALLAMLGVWNVNFLGIHAHAVLPYAHRLRLLPDYLQQLEMESNGKSVDREGRPVGYATCPVLFGAEGTNAQHAFMQLLHQGPQAVAADFIDCSVNGTLSANAQAQADALAYGTNAGTGDANLPSYKQHPGGRPSSILKVRNFSARDLGSLLALYEHKVFTQGVLWNINSFDQWGVELGKQLAGKIMKKGS